MNSALYVGHVQHRRLRPRVHRLRYRFFWTLLDLAELDLIARRCALFSRERFNLFSFHEADHLASGGNLRGQIEALLAQAGVMAGGAIRVMCMPRILGFVFNPISLFFCHQPDGALVAMIYEVNNTFGQRHCYFFAVQDGPVISHGCDKELYVSPFMTMRMRYEFTVTQPAEQHALKINGFDDDGMLIVTNFMGRRREISDATLLASFLSHPMLTLKVVAGIHFEALLLWLKGIRIVPRPAPPGSNVTINRLDKEKSLLFVNKKKQKNFIN